MKFIVSSTALSSRLQALSRVISQKSSLPILNSFLFELQDGTLTVTASDVETTLATTLEVNESDADGRFAAKARTMLDALKEIPEQPLTIEVNLSTFEMTVSYLNGQFCLMSQDANEYPMNPALGDNAVRIEMDADVLLDGVNCVLFSTGEDPLRPVMNGMYFDVTSENITLVATDGHKLVRYQALSQTGNERSAFVLPKKPANMLKGLLGKDEGKVLIEFDNRNAIFTMQNYRMISRLVEGRFPNYASVIPKNNPYRATVDRMALIGALRRVSICSSQSTSLIKLRLQDNLIVISGQDVDFSTSAEENLTCQYTGTPMNIGFKSTFLIDILNNINAEEVVLELADPSRAGLFVPAEQTGDIDLLMLLMPMMLND